MSRREQAITYMIIAGYHNDTAAFTRLIIESRVNRQACNEAWMQGQKAKAAGMKCTCYECTNGK